jgi:hypothetical protein
MAAKNIVVKDSGLKLVLFPRTKDAGTEFTLNAQESKKLRDHVSAYVENDSRELPYADRLRENKRVGLKRNNGLFKGSKGKKVYDTLMKAKARANGSNVSVQAEAQPEAVAAGKNEPRKRTKSDVSKMTKADLVRLIEEAGLVK